MSGKGSKPRPLSIDRDEYAQKWDEIFGQKAALKKFSDDYQDILSTEECVEAALENYVEGHLRDK
ncbi:hypothetical protein [uncultured phage]|nr:hypothetical protein [uncultured phage]